LADIIELLYLHNNLSGYFFLPVTCVAAFVYALVRYTLGYSDTFYTNEYSVVT